MPAETAIVDFGSAGTWLTNGNILAPTWSQITPSAPFGMVAIHSGATAGGLPIHNLIFADSDSKPWLWSKAGGFSQMTLSTLDAGFCEPYQARGLADHTGRQQAACDFGTQGLWEYDQAGTWKQLTPSNPVFMIRGDYYADGAQTTLVANFGSGVGLWMYDSGGADIYTPIWHLLTMSVPDSAIGW